ncbi:Mobile element protein [hydrothermal vent metagenome]|uniref:Mobile element protein n=1 Tax=hydrothermal vent metagenome TaxID=652676 RepID=A0A3B1A3U4_9ZZZZ
MATQTKDTLGTDTLDVVADRGYYSGLEILGCEEAQITAYLPRVQTSTNQSKGLFGKRDFKWIAQDNEYECPAGERLKWRFETEEAGKVNHKYWSSNCPTCPMKPQCTTGKYRRVTRWEHEDVLDRAQDRIDREPECMQVRRETVEHPFGTIKSWMGSTHFQMKTLKHVSTEMSLHVLAYNLKRVIKILGSKPLIEALQA